MGDTMVYLHAHIANRMRPFKKVLGGIRQAVEHTVLAVAQAEVHLAVGQFLQRLDARNQVVVLVFQHEVHIGCERSGIESGDENGFRPVTRVCYRPVGTLNNKRPKPALQQDLGDFLRSGFSRNGGLEFLVFDNRVGIDYHRHYPAFFAAADSRHGTAHRRGEEYLRTRLVEKQRGTRFHSGTLRNEQFRRDARKAIRNDGIGGADGHLDHCLLRFAYQPDVETTFQFYDFRHTMIY